MTRRRTENSVSLFPFLAVLVCTMGALILLLLVTTRRIRQKQLDLPAAAMASTEDSATVFVGDSETEPAIAAWRPVAELAAAMVNTFWAHTAHVRAQEFRNAAARIVEAAAGEVDKLESSAAELRARTAVVSRRNAKAEQTVESIAEEASRLQSHELALKSNLQESRLSLQEKYREWEQLESAAGHAEQQLAVCWSALTRLRAAVQQQADQPAESGVTQTVVEFSNPSGTTRTPIIVDVTAGGFHFPASGITIKNDDLLGFSPTNNPLEAAVRAIHRTRAGQSVTAQPYVVLLVRPGGTLGFYPAQRVLRECGIHFGYELITDDVVPGELAAVEGEAEAVRTAILDLLARRSRYFAAAEILEERLHGSARGRFRHQDDPTPSRIPRSDESQGERDRSSGLRPPGNPNPPSSQFPSNPPMVRAAENPAADDRNSPARRFEALLSGAPDPSMGARDDENSDLSADTLFGPQYPDEAAIAPLDEFWANLEPLEPTSGEPVKPRPSHAATPENSRLHGTVANESSAPRNSGTRLALPQPEGAYRPRSQQPVQFPDSSHPTRQPAIAGSAIPGGIQGDFLSTMVHRSVTVYLDPGFMTVGCRTEIRIGDRTPEQVATRLLDALYDEIRNQPRTMDAVVVPTPTFIVSPGAHTLHLQLAGLLYRMGIPSSSTISLEPLVSPEETAPIAWPALRQPSPEMSPARPATRRVSASRRIPR